MAAVFFFFMAVAGGCYQSTKPIPTRSFVLLANGRWGSRDETDRAEQRFRELGVVVWKPLGLRRT